MEAGVGEGGGGTVKIHGLSVIIPNHNHGRFLDVSILSSLNFHGIDVEIIVVDDASTDDSLEILEKYSNNKRIKIVKQPSQKGIAYTRINGFKNATKEYITAIDTDDSFLKNGMKRVAPPGDSAWAGQEVAWGLAVCNYDEPQKIEHVMWSLRKNGIIRSWCRKGDLIVLGRGQLRVRWI